jgi:hypothetical protein
VVADDRGPADTDVMAPVDEVRKRCLALPEASERISHGEPTWYVREKKAFVRFADNHHGDGRLAFWCPAPPGAQEELVRTEPDRFFRPPYVGHHGWLGVRLDVDVDWAEVDRIVRDAYRLAAPKALAALVED